MIPVRTLVRLARGAQRGSSAALLGIRKEEEARARERGAELRGSSSAEDFAEAAHFQFRARTRARSCERLPLGPRRLLSPLRSRACRVVLLPPVLVPPSSSSSSSSFFTHAAWNLEVCYPVSHSGYQAARGSSVLVVAGDMSGG